jgi:hypothetical protein
MSEESFQLFLEKAPSHFGGLVAGYVNGTVIRESHSRSKPPAPRTVDGEYDDIDYQLPINGAALRPGVLFENIGTTVDGVCTGRCLTNSGLLVQKRETRCITGSCHGWDISDDDKAVYHGGKMIGYVKGVLGEDIALIESKYKFQNTFLDIDCAATKFVPSVGIKNGDIVLLDSCFTGCQQMIAAGIRTGAKRTAVDGPSDDTWYIRVAQGIYSINSPIIESAPQLRAGACGTPLVRIGNKRLKTSNREGEIVGFWLWADIKGYAKTLSAYAQIADPLIEDGWSIVKVLD